MSSTPHSLILASAGTGKTYRLSSRFLTLLFRGVPPERILATTFTRKAAGEILDRVLERLMEATMSKDKCKELGEAVNKPQLSQKECLALLCQSTRHLNTFQVRTIDSFFVHLTKLFALDLELPPGWRITDERVDARVRSEALQQVLANESKQNLALLIGELNKGKAGRGIHQSLLDHIAMMRGIHLEANAPAWDSFAVGTPVSDELISASVAALESMELPKTAKGTNHASFEKGVHSLISQIRNGQWEAVVVKGIGSKLLAGEGKFYGKEISDECRDAMEPLIQQASYVLLSEIRSHNLAARGILTTFEHAYQEKKHEQGAYGFADLPHAFAPRSSDTLPVDERGLDMWFRLDGRIDHLLLDEFQDTSPIQWRILEPIAAEISSDYSGDRSFFCVGDIKQSIYSFRQAEPRLLRDLPSILPGLESDMVEYLSDSYRSSQVILDTVNTVFEALPETPLFDGNDYNAHRTACHAFMEGWESHKAVRKDLPGAAYLVQTSDDEDKGKALVDRIVERVCQIHTEAPGASIGILTRTRKHIPRIINSLSAVEIEASGEGGNVLTDARSVLVFISLLHLADFPDDSAAAFHLATSPFGKDLGLEGQMDSEARFALSAELRSQLALLGLAGLVAEYAEKVVADDSWSAWDRARFGQLLDLAYAFEQGDELRPSAFVDHIRNCRVEVPGGAKVRVMTIHASKGLEFDAVILPELSNRFVPKKEKMLISRPQAQDLIEATTVSPKKELLPLSQQLQDLHDEQLARSVGDDLCVLYVAMTRAARRLDMIIACPVEKKTKSKAKPTIADHLRASLGANSEGLEEDGVLWHATSDKAWHAEIEAGEAPAAAPLSQPIRLRQSESPRNLPRRTPSSEEGKGQRQAADAFKSDHGANLGTLVHALLEELEWSESFNLEEAQQQSAFRRNPAIRREQAKEMVSKAMGNKVIAKALSQAGCPAPVGATLSVEPEARVSLYDGERLWNGSIDRLVLARKDGEIVWAEITDYKTDNPKDGNLGQLVEHYRPQLNRYAEMIGKLYGLGRESIRCQLLFLGAGAAEVVE